MFAMYAYTIDLRSVTCCIQCMVITQTVNSKFYTYKTTNASRDATRLGGTVLLVKILVLAATYVARNTLYAIQACLLCQA